jgi:NADH-quinone oxidoreductase subunit C
MLTALPGKDVAAKLNKDIPDSVVEFGDDFVVVTAATVAGAARILRDDDQLSFDFLVSQTAVDYYDYFEVVYHLISYQKHQSLTLKTRVYDRDKPELPSVYEVWQGADFQEREIFDLMGINFTGHPNMRRIFLWEGFQGYPLRKDYLGPKA